MKDGGWKIVRVLGLRGNWLGRRRFWILLLLVMGCEGWNVCTARALLFLGLLPDCPFLLKYFEIGFTLERG